MPQIPNRITHSFYFGGCRFRRVDTNQFSCIFSSAPPLLPGLIAASVWISFPVVFPLRRLLLTIHRTDPSEGLRTVHIPVHYQWQLPVLDFQLIGIADAYYFNGFQSIFTHIRNFHSDYRQIVVGIRSLDLSFIHRIIIKSDRNSICISYYMIIRCYQDLTVILSYNDTGAELSLGYCCTPPKKSLYRFYRRIRNRYNRRHTTFATCATVYSPVVPALTSSVRSLPLPAALLLSPSAFSCCGSSVVGS